MCKEEYIGCCLNYEESVKHLEDLSILLKSLDISLNPKKKIQILEAIKNGIETLNMEVYRNSLPKEKRQIYSLNFLSTLWKEYEDRIITCPLDKLESFIEWLEKATTLWR